MEEKVLIKSEKYDVKKAIIVMAIIGIVLSLLVSISYLSDTCKEYNEDYADHEHDTWCYSDYYEDEAYDDWWDNNLQESKMDCYPVKYGSALSFAFVRYFPWQFYPSLIPAAVLTLIGGLIYLWLRSYELTVTNKRIYGKVAWGKRVDLPVDSISATSTIRLFKGVSVSTASGRISFRVMKNADEIYNVINNLLIERQQEKAKPEVVQTIQATDEADQLKKYKDLLDSGVITQEEFDAKKKQLLGL